MSRLWSTWMTWLIYSLEVVIPSFGISKCPFLKADVNHWITSTEVCTSFLFARLWWCYCSLALWVLMFVLDLSYAGTSVGDAHLNVHVLQSLLWTYSSWRVPALFAFSYFVHISSSNWYFAPLIKIPYSCLCATVLVVVRRFGERSRVVSVVEFVLVIIAND